MEMEKGSNKEGGLKEAKVIMWSVLFLFFVLPIISPPVVPPPLIAREGDQEVGLIIRVLCMCMMFYLLFPPFHRKQLIADDSPIKLALIRCAVAFCLLWGGVYQIFP